jgi:hypothetical protein
MNKMLVAVVAAALAVSSCAPMRQMTRDEAIAATTRH